MFRLKIEIETQAQNMLRWVFLMGVIQVIGLQLHPTCKVVIACYVMARFYPIFPSEDLYGHIGTETAVRDGVLDFQAGSQFVSLSILRGYPGVQVALSQS